MTTLFGRHSAVCMAALIAGGAAHADVTAAQVWDDWKAQMMLYGESNLSIGAEETSSGTVTVRDLSLRMSDDEITVDANIGDIMFNELSDGTVRVTMDESYPLVITGVDGTVVNILVSQSNLEMIVNGDPDALGYEISADSYTIALDDIVDGDVTFTGDAQIVMNGVAGSYATQVADLRNISYDFGIRSLDMLVDIQIPGENGEYVTGAGKIASMQMQGEMAVPLDADFEDPDSLVADGFSIAGGYTIDGADYVFDINAEGDQTAGSISTGNGVFTGEMNGQTLAYNVTTNDLAVSIQTSEFPLPIDVAMAEYGLGFEMPVGQSDDARPFGLSFDLIGLDISDNIWNLFDADNVLPRDPATVQLALVGQAKALFDMLDPAQQGAMMQGDLPYELEELKLDTLNINAAGAAITGDGAFTFDNSDMQSFAPFPKPLGEALVEISGVNTLLDNLIAMGLVPEQDVTGARMMMGMFARSTGEDQMETKLVVNSEGQVLVNGNRVR